MTKTKAFLSGLLLAMLISFPVCSQEANSDKYLSSHFTTIIGGYSPKSVFLLGKTRDTKTWYTYLGTGKKIQSFLPGFTAYRTFGVIPYVNYDYEKRDDSDRHHTAYGFGISPVGYEFLKPVSEQAYFNMGITSGIMYMSEYFPTSKARRLNYSFDLSLSFQHFISQKTSISLGYRFHHISNAQTGTHNPGVDSNFLFFTIKKFSNGTKSSL